MMPCQEKKILRCLMSGSWIVFYFMFFFPLPFRLKNNSPQF